MSIIADKTFTTKALIKFVLWSFLLSFPFARAQALEKRSPVWHLMGYGQSLSLGVLGIPALTTDSSADDIMFSSGIRRPIQGRPEDDFFKPLAETNTGSRGETGVAAAVEMFRLTLAEMGRVSPSALDFEILGSSAGRAGASISGLLPGSKNYQGLLDDVKEGLYLADEEQRSYRYLATLWSNGETDQLKGTDRSAYISRLQTLAGSVRSHVSHVSKGSWQPPLLAYQPSSHRTYLARRKPITPETPEIALAIREAAHSSDGIYCIMPLYWGDFVDGIHATNYTYQQIGKYYGRALARLFYANENNLPLPALALDLEKANWIDKRVFLKFSVPHPPIVFDTKWVKEASNMGFDLWKPNGELDRNAISNVSIVSANEVAVTFANEPSQGSRLSYAFGRPDDPMTGGRMDGPRGNLRDSDTGSYTVKDGGIRNLYNWSLIFEVIKP
ncbi:hypothetical protein F9K79_22405 [Ochrobactrum sp. Kaboul]|nr:hypothetical protein F9K79_22405 [Ochrobactrum sp. Kaboul]